LTTVQGKFFIFNSGTIDNDSSATITDHKGVTISNLGYD
jgi:hypothetical protein